MTISLLIVAWSFPRLAAASCSTNLNQQSCSSGYGVSETFFGSGGQLNSCSAGTYCSKQSAGELTVGNTVGTAYEAQNGFNTDRTPWISLSVTKTSVNLGVVKTTTTGSDYATFNVESYLAHGYVVQIVGTPPVYSSHTITALATPTASSSGTEQFGINLRVNTTPAIGADPVQSPDNTFSFGTYATGYGTPNSYKYVNGGTIAQSTSSTGFTNYTISYIMNISTLTPAGTYTTNQAIVATSTF